MTRRMLACLFLLSFAVALLATLPLSTALALGGAEEQGLAARSVTGSVWNGGLEGASLHGLAIGDVSVRLDGKTLLFLRPRFALRAGGRSTVFDLRDGIILSGEAP